MENIEPNKELLISRNNDKKSGFIKNSIILKWIIKITIWISFIFWVFVIFMYPLQSSESLIQKWSRSTSHLLGLTGSAFVIFSGPIVVISVLSVLYIVLDSVQDSLQDDSIIEKQARYRLRTFPIIVRGPFGIISAAEMIGIMIFGLYIIWVASVYALQKLANVFSNPQYTTTQQKWSEFVRECGKGCGVAGLVCISFMMITATRGSTVLRLLNIQPQDAIRYHIWVSHLSLTLFTFHAFLYLFGWFLIGGIPSKMIMWQSTEVAHLPGIINILISWMIWVTSIPSIRFKNFELFYYSHYLYILFIVFLAMHIGNFLLCIVAGPILLFIIDYFLRLFQSQKCVDVISTTSFPCDVVELVMPITQNLKHNALSSVFLRIKEISPIQWHPFSVTTTPLDGKSSIAILIKASGNWTSQLKHKVLDHPTKLNASIEGPYGHDVPDYLRFKYLVLVAGGIGISPFIALLSDVMHRIKLGKPCRPRNIVLIWTMKRSNKLSLFSTIDMETQSNLFHELKDFQITIYVTQELQPQSENIMLENPIVFSNYSSSKTNLISDLASSGHKIWFATYIISSTIGFILIISAINILYIRPFEITNWGFQAILLLACMVASVLIFGGSIIGLSNILEKKNYSKGAKEAIHEEQSNEYIRNTNSFLEYFSSLTTFHYGSRPNFTEIFGSIGSRWGHGDVGVIVCGPKSLEESVARECRSLNLTRKSNQPIFHFTCHSFNF